MAEPLVCDFPQGTFRRSCVELLVQVTFWRLQVAVEVEQGLADYKAATSKVDRIKEGYGWLHSYCVVLTDTSQQ